MTLSREAIKEKMATLNSTLLILNQSIKPLQEQINKCENELRHLKEDLVIVG